MVGFTLFLSILEGLIEENESIQEIHFHEMDKHNQLLQETDFLQQKLNEIRSKQRKIQENNKVEFGALYTLLEKSKKEYSTAEDEYQCFKQEMRVEMHDDKTLIKDLEDSLVEADMILGSLVDKAKFSNKLEIERQRMINDRFLLLKDL